MVFDCGGTDRRVEPIGEGGPRASRCPVTAPNGDIPPGQSQNPGADEAPYLGNGKLWTVLYPEGVTGSRRTDGSVEEKFPWWRGVRGALTISGVRLDAPGAPVRARIPRGYGVSGFQSTAIVFPTDGCWRITGSAGSATLTFVTSVAGPA